MRTTLVLLSWWLLCSACGDQETTTAVSGRSGAEVTTVYLVRHAEKGDGEDPDLTEAGRERAERLSRLLADEEIVAVFTTPFRRTRQTATPTAEHQGVPVSTYDAGQLTKIAERVVNAHRGGSVLVVGHSNTTPELATILSEGETFEAISEDDYGTLLVISIPTAGRPSVERRTY